MPQTFAAAAIALSLLMTACADEPPACAPGAACANVGSAAPGDPRFVGDGMRGASLPHWPMFRHDPQHSGENAVAPPALPTVIWTFPTQGEIWSSPAVGLDGTIYIGSNDKHLYALTRQGKLKWAFETMGYVFSSPAVAGDGTVSIPARSTPTSTPSRRAR